MWSFYRRNNLLISSANIISPIPPSSRLHLSAGKNITCSRFSVFSPISVASKSKPRLGFYQRFDLGRRFYHHSSEEPIRRSYYKQFFHKLEKLVIVSAVLSYGYYVVLNENNIVPYTNRTRFFPMETCNTLLVSISENRMKAKTKDPVVAERDPMFQFLPETDPQSVRVRRILKVITDALYKDLKKNGVKVKHLDGLKWEIFVMAGPQLACVRGGKILICSTFLEDFTSDAEVATVIGHEIGHIVARHGAERLITCELVSLILLLPRLVFSYLVPIPWVADMIQDLPYRSVRRHELEADYIGMILIALAGYDPQLAPSVEIKLSKLYPQTPCRTHPTSEERALMLTRVVEEVRAKYKEVEGSNLQKD